MKKIITIILVVFVSYTDSFAGNFKNADVYAKNAYKKVKQKNYTGAIKDYNKVIESKNDSVELYHDRGAAKANLELYEAAIKDYTKAIELSPKFGDAYYNRGVAKYYIDDKKGALKDLKKSEELGVKKAHDIIEKIKD